MTDARIPSRALNPVTGREYRMRPSEELEQDVWEAALERVRGVYATHDTVAVSFSGGKDSTATLHAALEVAHELDRLPLRAVFFDEEAIPFETEHYVRRVAQREDVDLTWYCLPVKHRNASSREHPNWWPWAPEARDLWVRPMPPEAVTTLAGFPTEPPSARLSIPDAAGLLFDPAKDGQVAMLMGIRADESITRRRAIIANRIGEAHVVPLGGETSRGNIDKVYPIYDWSSNDVWEAPARFGWDYNAAYDHMEMAGVPIGQQRCAPPWGEEPLGGLWVFSVCFPDVWDRMVDRVPGSAAASRYARTELYAFGKREDRPEGMPLMEWLRILLLRHPPKVRAVIAERLTGYMRLHAGRTADPILNVPHHLSGVSWPFILTIATRGDLKNRKQVTNARVNYERDKARYEAEHARVIAAGTLEEYQI